MLEEHTRQELERRLWIVVDENANISLQKATLLVLQKTYTNGVDVMLSIHYEEGQYRVYRDVGHAASGTNRTNQGTFSTVNTAVQALVEECYEWDLAWE